MFGHAFYVILHVMDTPRIAIIGAGRWGKNILKSLSKNPSTIAYIAHGGSAETKAFLAEQYPAIPAILDYTDALNDSAVDAAIIATPIPTHYDIARSSLLAGKHTFVEKPLALTRAEVVDLYALADEKKLTLMCGYLYRFDPEFIALCTRAANAHRVDLDFVWTKYGSFTSPITHNLLVHELSLMLSIYETVRLESVTAYEADVFDATFVGARGTAHVHIDRTKQERVKRMTATIDGEVFSYDFTSDNLLDIELNAFLTEIKNKTPNNKNRQRIDESIAVILENLSKR